VTGEGASATPAEQTKGIIEQRGGEAVINTDSVASWNSARNIVQTAIDAFGRIDVVVNNAGIQHVAAIEDFPDDAWDRVISINLSAVFHAMKAAIPGMRARGWGRILNIASAHGLVASGQKVAYVAAKHGVVGMTKVAAIELAGSGATANAICPGWVLTPLVERQLSARAEATGMTIDAVKDAFLAEKQPLREFSTPEQIGAAAVFLCSEGARTITGTSLSVDGGWTIQ
jgi:3-hydroxybutyrate dehydrogenase